jgi:hypothetical protein
MPPGRALAREDAAPATSERQQHACTNEVGRNATLHARKNASSFFNGVSTLAGDDFVKDKDSLPPATRPEGPYLGRSHRARILPSRSIPNGRSAGTPFLHFLRSRMFGTRNRSHRAFD